ncbi:translation elongation factor Ts [Candidatus Beckwithbacteria bacterium RBG_13_42_9]|uniref:Elongation factor Ts n=1 Tax=Candidatus Beckwithbacteria bacterium RBG_13_42_9 TaxID=1797457 RepID=A0A1F5E815_9BACT|nr:MAG: translation elongation factor Ts [Candidatus Beckwithbacteria bacterium RBG_13_42_9]
MEQIKQLREETKAGVMDARQALVENDGDIKKAKEWLVKKGLDKAAKKADRETCEGLVESYIHHGGRVGAIVKLTCETDFVARTDEFKTLARELAMQVASMDPQTVDELLAQDYIRDTSKKVEDLIKETIAKVGENIKVEEIKRMGV